MQFLLYLCTLFCINKKYDYEKVSIYRTDCAVRGMSDRM